MSRRCAATDPSISGQVLEPLRRSGEVAGGGALVRTPTDKSGDWVWLFPTPRQHFASQALLVQAFLCVPGNFHWQSLIMLVQVPYWRMFGRNRYTVTADCVSGAASMSTQAGHAGHKSHFGRHLLEMTVVMIIGMVAAGTVMTVPFGLTVDQALTQFPVLFCLGIAFGMTVLMVAWMRHRGHGWGSCSEMAATMIVPAFPFIVLFWLGVITGPFCGLFCIASFLAMIGLMLFRRDEYSM